MNTVSKRPARTPDQEDTIQTSTSRQTAPNAAASFVVIGLNMSWQLLLVFVLPLIGGRWLDDRFGWSPVATIAGLLVGIAGTVVVVRQSVRQFNEAAGIDGKGVR